MLRPIKDYKKHVVCYADDDTGIIECKYKRQTTVTIVPVGGIFSIVRENTKTDIERISITAFNVRSYPAVI